MSYLLHPLRNHLAKFGLAAVIGPVLVADKTKSDDFDLWPGLDDLLPFYDFQILFKSTHWELSIAASPTSLWLLVRELAGGGVCVCVKFTPASAARSAGDPSNARVNLHPVWGRRNAPPPTTFLSITKKKNEQGYRHQTLRTPSFINFKQPDQRNFFQTLIGRP